MAYGPREDSVRDEDYVELSPDDPDWDLSEEAGYGEWEPRRRFPWGRWLMIGIAALLVAALTVPLLLRAG